MNYFNLNEGIDIFYKETRTLKPLGVIDFRFTVFLTEYHFNAHYNKRIPKLEELLGLDLNRAKYINLGKSMIMSHYQTFLSASKFEDKYYPRIRNSSAMVYHTPVHLHVGDKTHTLDIGVLATCEALRTTRAPRKLGKENYDFYINNCDVPQLLDAIKRGNLINFSPLFLVKTVAFDLTENSTELTVFKNVMKHMVITDHLSARPIELTIDEDTFNKVKDHVEKNKFIS